MIKYKCYFMALLLIFLFIGSSLREVFAQGDFLTPVPTDQFPNYVAVGTGIVPDYLGSDDYIVGAAPLARYDYGSGSVSLIGNWALWDLTEAGGWRFGPAAMLRFGRKDVEDDVVKLVSEIDNTIDLGGSVGYEFIDPENPLKRLAVGADGFVDAGGVHNGVVVNAYARAMYPLGWQGGVAAIFLGTSWGSSNYTDTYFSVSQQDSQLSGLPQFTASSGMRDARIGLGIIQSFSPHWHLGVGGSMMQLIGDAADSPLVRDRGSRTQIIFGVGLAYTWSDGK